MGRCTAAAARQLLSKLIIDSDCLNLFIYFFILSGMALFIPQYQIRHPKVSAAMQRLKAAAKVYLSKLRLLAAAAADQAVQAAAVLLFILSVPMVELVRS